MAIKDLIPKIGKGRDRALARPALEDPFRDFQVELNRLFGDFFGEFGLTPSRGRGAGFVGSRLNPRIDVKDTKKDIIISAELPGLEEKDITVDVDETAVSIHGERRDEQESEDGEWYRREQVYGTFSRVIPLHASVDAAKAKARFRSGVLKITLPKRATDPSRRKTVAIQAG
ncbi:MAG: Hsp20/alpha crystallin family protein [Verrucomicrobia bacterium]|nr:Hsp20/alpha crystallin family protein [Verrucomicrobiota bacterium]